ncbi:hybrid sensor histidine kinase/response regulator [Nostoc sp. UCD121]|uniref:hybrid sensor histidine kinase/response regulator n=1 Tax=unclassified Nostoc TaxID=2593658 RepID=UPI001626111D|nr:MULTISPECIES: response regulator [unclassified Nostoc]MBC1224949.1 hybrid sensor histidine kinase/response regulator [Nostoc sp. UCD120]MBC1274575.1 hybrid sensor histidine kinase/response regulator [Nostoc sp. UCD121]MBC1297087.1 hybrid sensor histidine kinase/response regulator [Nostoc sp. UCD122]
MIKLLNNGFILIVDDNPTNLSVLCAALNSEGFRFRVAVDGETAIAQAERNQPELILLDVQMPGIDGFETCRRLKANPATQNIPIIFTTALADTESKTKGFSLGAVDYIPKPFAQEEVIARVRVHLQLKKLTESLEQQVSDRTKALQQAQVQLVQQEKLSTLGELIAGIGHEINNPINFISSNIPPLEEYIAGVTELLLLYEQEYPNPTAKITTAIEKLDLNFVLEDMVKIVNSLQLGSERIQNLSNSLRNFSRSDSDTKILADLHQGLDSTLMILQHRLKPNGERPGIEVIKSYGVLPEVNCYLGQMNQVFMNILANAIDALDEAIMQGKLSNLIPEIKIVTEIDSEQLVIIRVADNGIGIPERLKQRLFEPLFTTKTVGKGTGLGLSIAYEIVVEKHKGVLDVNSQPGKGTEFIIKIPIK